MRISDWSSDVCSSDLAEGLTCAVAEREDDVIGFEYFAARERHAVDAAVFDTHVGDLLFEAHFTAERFDFLAHACDHAGQAEGADMRLADVEDFVRRAGLDEFVQHLAAVELRVLDLTVELAVAEQAGAAFAELHVRRRVQHALAPQADRKST